MVRDQAKDNLLNGNVPNPYNLKGLAGLATSNPTLYRFVSGQGFYTNQNIARHRILRGYSMYNNLRDYQIGGDGRIGDVRYHDMQLLVERRMTSGFQTSFMYTYADSKAKDYFYNEFDQSPSDRINDNTRPHAIAWTAVYETPFGKGRKFVSDGAMSHIVGNWNLSWVYVITAGEASDWGNRFFYGDINQLEDLWKHKEVRSKDYLAWFDPNLTWRTNSAPPSGFVGFEGRSAAQPGSYHVRMFPYRLGSLRHDGIKNLDLKIERLFPINMERGIQARFAFDMLNAVNHTNFGGPNTDPTNAAFGRVTSQRGLSRVLQFTLRFEF
jgi:hypothetical protein